MPEMISSHRNQGPAPLLTVAVPTFNRARKIARLLEWLEKELETHNLVDEVAILVANNGSTDDTSAVLAAASSKNIRLRYWTHSENRGFDGNVLFLYQHTTTPYVWFMSDDDEPLSGAIGIVRDALTTHSPDLLLFPHIQPPGSWRTEHEFPRPYRLITEASAAVDLAAQHGKVSVYVLRVGTFSEAEAAEVKSHMNEGFMFKILAFTVLQRSPALKLVVLSKPMVTSDDDFCRIPWSPATSLESHRIYTHSFVRKYLPNLAKEAKRIAYLGGIRFLWDGQVGALTPSDTKAWDDVAARLEWQWEHLWRHPAAVIRLFLVKSGLGYCFRSGLPSVIRRHMQVAGRYSRNARWLTTFRCRYRRLRDYFRRRRVFLQP